MLKNFDEFKKWVLWTLAGVQKKGVTSMAAILPVYANKTIVPGDIGRLIRVSDAITITIPNDTADDTVYPLGVAFEVLRVGSGNVTVKADTDIYLVKSGSTLNKGGTVMLSEAFSSAKFVKYSTDKWVAAIF